MKIKAVAETAISVDDLDAAEDFPRTILPPINVRAFRAARIK